VVLHINGSLLFMETDFLFLVLRTVRFQEQNAEERSFIDVERLVYIQANAYSEVLLH